MIVKYVLIITLGGFTKGWQMGYGYSATDITYHPTEAACNRVAYLAKQQIRDTHEDMKKLTVVAKCHRIEVPNE